MPGGGARTEESPLETSRREFREETGYELISDDAWKTSLQDGYVFFGFIGNGDAERRKKDEIIEVEMFTDLPDDLAYPTVEYEPLIARGKKMLMDRII